VKDNTTDINGSIPKIENSLTSLLKGWLGKKDDAIQVDAVDQLLRGIAIETPEPLSSLGIAAAKLMEKHPEEAVNLCMRLSGSTLPATRCLCAVIISQISKYQPGLWTDMVKHLALDDDWNVRDFAAGVYDSIPGREGLIEFHPDFVWETLAELVKDRDYLVRRLTTRALLGYFKQHPEIAQRLLTLWEPLLTDPNEFVRRNLVSALRVIGKKHPDLVLTWLDSKVNSPSGHVAEIAGLVLQSPFAFKCPELRQSMLEKFSSSSGN
jgi:hypothetical protein